MVFSDFVKNAICRTYSTAISLPKKVIPEKERVMLKGTGSLLKLPVYMKKHNIDNVLVIADKSILSRGQADGFLGIMKDLDISYKLTAVNDNATTQTVEKCAEEYVKGGCRAIAAIGGGAVIDCAKLASIKAAGRKTDMAALDGRKIILRRLPPVFAVPSTVGSGSECSPFAVCYDKKQKIKRIVSSSAIYPTAAVLDPDLIASLPKNVIAETAMASLCRAVEAYIASDTPKNKKDNAKTAVGLVFANIVKAYEQGDKDAIAELQKASYLSGVKAGYAHYGAQSVSAVCRVPYSKASAVLLPAVLRAYGDKAYKKLAELAESVKIHGESEKEKAERFIKAIEEFNIKLAIEPNLRELKKNSISKCAKTISKYCNPYYAAPKLLFYDEMCSVLLKIKG